MSDTRAATITDWVKPGDKSGEFKRQQSSFRSWISKDPNSEFPAEKGRTLIVRKLKGLEDIIGFTSVHWHLEEKGRYLLLISDLRFPWYSIFISGVLGGPFIWLPSFSFDFLFAVCFGTNSDKALQNSKGWRFATSDEKIPGDNTTPDPLHPEFTHLRDLYFAADKEYNARVTVPALWDKKTKTIVSNESSEIIRMLYTEFDDLLPAEFRAPQVDLYPAGLASRIEETNAWTYDDINNGVYKSGFATTQEAYEKNVLQLFKSLDRAEAELARSNGPFYFGDRVTEADVRLYTTIVRFDPVYVQHFKCNIKDIRSGYPNLHRWLRNLYWNVPAFGETTQFEHIKKHYTKSHKQINPFSITPVGPLPDILKLDEEVAAVAAANR
ncbi:S-glutathionyl-(chloro)hydroquinone reductase [Knufia peltigerae]|uniref:Glutathione S-transferase omega-like 2 n=1 Tax=Knufia peltigerae TaxID=1002370 RepID=A0AA38YC59_9EURO|nr:S-glutathionyl-(chloro)hydroquinone reductase [Knufia peltigerae]